MDSLQHTAISDTDANNYSTNPINVRLIDKFDEVVDETIATETDDDDDTRVTIKWKVRRVTRHRDNQEYSDY